MLFSANDFHNWNETIWISNVGPAIKASPLTAEPFLLQKVFLCHHVFSVVMKIPSLSFLSDRRETYFCSTFAGVIIGSSFKRSVEMTFFVNLSFATKKNWFDFTLIDKMTNSLKNSSVSTFCKDHFNWSPTLDPSRELSLRTSLRLLMYRACHQDYSHILEDLESQFSNT